MSGVDPEAVAGLGVIGCGCVITGAALAILSGLVVLVWRLALGL